jgi:hypothetical protein
MDLSILLMFVNSSKVAGWTRAGVGAIIAAAIAKWPLLKEYMDPATQAALATAASGLAVGVWSHIAKQLDTQHSTYPQAPRYNSQGALQ